MKKIIETIKNIWRIEDLRVRILITLLFVAIYRFGSFIVLPGINPNKLGALQEQTSDKLEEDIVLRYLLPIQHYQRTITNPVPIPDLYLMQTVKLR